LMMLQLNQKNDQLNRLSTYYAARMITKEWMQPIREPHEIFSVTVSQTKSGTHVTRPTVTTYAMRRPDKQWALLAINKDPRHATQLRVEFNLRGATRGWVFIAQVKIIQFPRQQSAWHADGPNGPPTRSLPPAKFTREASAGCNLPPYSLTVLRGRVAE